MEQAGLWEDTAVIVSADHVWRRAKILDGVKSTTVPMMVKLPHKNKDTSSINRWTRSTAET